MKIIYFPEDLTEIDQAEVGGKALALFQLVTAGLRIPPPLCVGAAAYDIFVDHNNLREKIGLELYRKSLSDMRWEEIWDASLRIQNLFIKGSLPGQLEEEIRAAITAHFGVQPLVVRSSAPEEDGSNGSFAGLHESYINIQGEDGLRQKIKRVWASLWSDRAILYRQELGLELLTSRMAVVVQPFIEGSASGVLFTRNPLDEDQILIEAVHGLNQGLVDGAVAPDRWVVSREDRRVIEHRRPERRDRLFAAAVSGGAVCSVTDHAHQKRSPLSDEELEEIIDKGLEIEQFYQSARDVEWTIANGQCHILQARPITARAGGNPEDKRSWYLSLTRSFENLVELQRTITDELLPAMDGDADRLAAASLEDLSDAGLAEEIRRRMAINEHWTAVYWNDFIPFAHGVRLFGEIYNEVIEPDDPFEFVGLLTGQQMLSTERNRLFAECARLVRHDADVLLKLREERLVDIEDEQILQKISQLRSRFSADYASIGTGSAADRIIASMILQYVSLDQHPELDTHEQRQLLENDFIARSRGKLAVDPERLLSLARASYRLRDDDNIHLGRIGQELERAVLCARKRLADKGSLKGSEPSGEDLCALLEGKTERQSNTKSGPGQHVDEPKSRARARQLQGQPASRGIAAGRARVILEPADLADFNRGEVLVIDSIDPTMTFFAPLAAAIIERRGGMLIHGAIIAREYGIPCITGVVDATKHIQSGDHLTVDGYLGICTVRRRDQCGAEMISETAEDVL
jgi:phosphohistidine swiveling domain-containing protein